MSATATIRDPHTVLGIRKNATRKAIDRAYRKLAMRHHPDRNPGDDEAQARFQEVEDAYRKLTDREVKVDNAKSQAFSVLYSAFSAAVQAVAQQNVDPKTTNFVGLMEKGIGEILKNLRKEIAQMEKAKREVEVLRGRFSGNDKESFEGMIDFHVEAISREISGRQERLPPLERALAILKDTSFRCDPATMRSLMPIKWSVS